MREILFRGKTKQGEWVYGYPNIYDDGSINFVVSKLLNSLLPLEDCCVSIEYDTLGQFTGLTDKNGKKIIEGDIVKAITLDTNTEQLAVVGFGKFVDENNDDEYLGFYIEFDGFKTTITQLEMKEIKDRFEVIGNIHDNPKLLKEQDNEG